MGIAGRCSYCPAARELFDGAGGAKMDGKENSYVEVSLV